MKLIEKAVIVATKAHEGQERKGTDILYISHPVTVGFMLQQQKCSQEVVAAGILHDTVEDTDITLEDIKQEFGDKVAKLVEGASEPNKNLLWEERKKHTLEHLKNASWEVRLLSCADKLHNLQTIYEDYKNIGDKVWERFSRSKQKQEWYYRGLVDSLCNHTDIPEDVTIFDEFKNLVQEFFD